MKGQVVYYIPLASNAEPVESLEEIDLKRVLSLDLVPAKRGLTRPRCLVVIDLQTVSP